VPEQVNHELPVRERLAQNVFWEHFVPPVLLDATDDGRDQLAQLRERTCDFRARHVLRREFPRPVALIGHAANLAADVLAQIAVQVQQQVASGVRHSRANPPQVSVVDRVELARDAGEVAGEQRCKLGRREGHGVGPEAKGQAGRPQSPRASSSAIRSIAFCRSDAASRAMSTSLS